VRDPSFHVRAQLISVSTVNVGIVIIAVVSMLVSFCGYKVLHHLERWAWIPIIFSFIMLTAFGGRHLSASMDFPASDATPGLVLSFASIIVGFSSESKRARHLPRRY
jgi:purine-cytosine permease-like protein